MKTYRIWASHCGDPSEIDEIFEAFSDKEARKKLEQKKKNSSYGYDYLWMERVDIREKTTRL